MFQTSSRSSPQLKVVAEEGVSCEPNKCSDFGETESQPPVEAYFLATLGAIVARQARKPAACLTVPLSSTTHVFPNQLGENGSAREGTCHATTFVP